MSGSTRRARILVAEDIPMNQIVVEAMLKTMGHVVTLVDNGREAVQAVQQADYDLVLMDMEMPEMDGIAATRAIQALGERWRQIPIVALTANAMLDDSLACLSAGMKDFLPKPVRKDELVRVIDKWTRPPAKPSQAEAPIPAATPILDEKTLGTLEEAIGRERASELSRISRSRFDEMRRSFQTTTCRNELAKGAHELIGTAGNVGCLELVDRAQALSAALRRDATDVDQLTAAVISAAERAANALDARYSK